MMKNPSTLQVGVERRVFNFQDFLPGHNDFHIQFILTAVI